MKNSNTITEIMIGDHALIELLLMSFRDVLDKNDESAEKLFEEFRWELEKHIFVEETVIFKPCSRLGSEICNIAITLSKEHGIMLDALNKLRDDLAVKNKIDISKFQELLTAHRNVEEKNLYPKLDEELTKLEKEMIVARINEIPIGKDTNDTI